MILGFATSSLAQAQYEEIDSIERIWEHVTSDSLVILDLDDTVIEPQQTLGGDKWFYDLIDQRRAAGHTLEAALELALQDWTEVQHHVTMKPVEPRTHLVIRKLQAGGNRVIGLTARDSTLADRTIQQLSKIGVDFKISPISRKSVILDEKTNLRYHEGIIFVGETKKKGQALLKFLDHHRVRPKHVIFLDDKEKHVRCVEETLNELGITHVALWYKGAEAKNSAYNRDIANLQWHHFKTEGTFLTDEEALKKLQ